MGIKYVPALDGLRAVAVLAVVAYHAGLPVPAGFVGVDVFFVISGYLITRLLADDLAQTGRIDFLHFYARRARRIFPAAFLVIAVTLALSFAILPTGQEAVAESAAAASVFGANFYFQATSGGYWDEAAETMPLLHLWSLAVEEQFYLVWPAILIFARRHRLAMMVTVSIASFALAEFLIPWGDAAFYQMPARFWELAAGGLIATMPQHRMAGWAAPAGVALTLLACVFTLGQHFPGAGALPAVLGTSLVIAAAHGGARVPVLEVRPVVYVGLISYSLYLWHWPLLVLSGAESLADRLAVCAASFALAAASYHFVETPFRRMRLPNRRTVMLGAACASTMGLLACAVVMVVPEDISHDVAKDRPPKACRYVQRDTTFPKCELAHQRIAVWGDSMAYSWRPAVEALGPTADFSRDACPPFLGYRNGDGSFEQPCLDFNTKVAKTVAGVNTLVITALWRVSTDPERLAGLRRTLAEVAPTVGRIVVIGPSPRMLDKVPRCIALAKDCAITRAEFDRKAKPDLAVLRAEAAAYSNVSVIDVSDRFCTETECPPIMDGVPLYWDSHHVSYSVSSTFPLWPDQGAVTSNF